MDKKEIYKYIKLGNKRAIEVDRRILEKYNGIYRRIIIMMNNRIKIEFADEDCVNNDEGEMTIYFDYSDYDELFAALEEYIGIKMSKWHNYNNDEFDFIKNTCDLEKSWNDLKYDFVNRKLDFPKHYEKMTIADIYWKGLYDKEINLSDGIEEIKKMASKKCF